LLVNSALNQGIIEGYKPEQDIHMSYLGEEISGGIINTEKKDLSESSFINPNSNLDASISEIADFETHAPIEILNNSAFGPTGYNFPGTGTTNDPYLIDGYNITDSSGTLIHIENTTAHFMIQDCLLDGISKAKTGIYLKNVTLGTIYHNVLHNNNYAIYLVDSETNNIIDNQIQDCGGFAFRLVTYSKYNLIKNNWINNTAAIAIALSNSGYNNITDNEIQNSAGGVDVYPSSGANRIHRNTITDLSSTGIRVKADSSAEVINNTLSNIEGYGVLCEWHTANNKIFGNIVSNTSLASICVPDAAGSAGYYGGAIISNNTILNSKQEGILLTGRNKGVIITRNTIFNSTGYGVKINANSNNSNVNWNNFFHNNGGGTQAYDNGTDNVFEYNHWNDYTGPDIDTDGYFDTGYLIEGGLGALKFDDSISSGTYAIINPVNTFVSDAITVELWMKSSGRFHSIWHNFTLVHYYMGAYPDAFVLKYENSTDELMIHIANGVVNTGCSLSENVWTHLVVTWRSSDGETALWKDGILQYTGNVSKGLTLDSTGWLLIGEDRWWRPGGFDGVLDEVRFLNRTLNPSEIQADYNAIAPYPARTGTIGWYHFDDSATTATNSAGGMGDGNIYNGVGWVDGVRGIDPYPRVAPIWINDNSDFADFAFVGNGTENNPYKIDGYQFISNKSVLIEIYNTSAHFVIQNSFFDGLNQSYALVINNVTNGVIENNIIYNTYCGIFLNNSDDNIISDNTIYNCSHYAIVLGEESQYNTISGNTFYHILQNGIWLNSTSRYNTIFKNTLNECNTSIYMSNAYNNTLSYNRYSNWNSYGVNLLNSDNNTIIYNDFYNNETSIYLSSSINNAIKWNNFLHKYVLFKEEKPWTEAKAACEALGGHLVTITDQTEYDFIVDLIIENGKYIYIWIGLTDNEAYGGQEDTENTGLAPYWVWVTGEPFTFSGFPPDLPNDGTRATIDYAAMTYWGWNDLYNTGYWGMVNGFWYICEWDWNNTVNHIVDLSGGNIISYNYWDNHTGDDSDLDGFIDDPYIGGVFAQDLFPRMIQRPEVTIISPITQIYSSSGFSVILMGNTYDYWYYIEGVDTQNLTWTMDIDRFIVTGTYTLHAYSNDSIGAVAHDSVSFTVDATPPSVDITSPISKAYNTDRISLIYTISDGTVIILINGVENTTAIPSGATSPFPEGEYNISFITEDYLGNIGITTVLFTVDTTPPTVTIDSPTATTYTTGTISISLSGDADSYWYYIAGVDTSNQTWTNAVTRTLESGTYTLYAYGNDSAGNVAHGSITFTVSIATTTTTTQESTSETTTTTTSKSGSFPNFLLIVTSLALALVSIRRYKKK
jgi:parallel beta-helix repeat protein